MRQLILTCTLALISLTAFAQGTFIDSIRLGGLPLQVFVQAETGIPVIARQYSFVGLDKMSGDSLWSIERGTLAGLGQKTSDNYDEAEDYVDIEFSPFVFIRGQLVDVRNGDMIIKADEEIKSFRGTRFIADQNLLLMELGGKDQVHLYGFDPQTAERKFKVDLRKTSGLAQSLAGNSAAAERYPDPIFDPQGRMLYFHKNYLSLIDVQGGKMMWNQKMDAKSVFWNESGDKLVVLEENKGLSLADYSKTVQLLEYPSGNLIWEKGRKMDGPVRFVQFYDGGFIVAHNDGFNIFDFDPNSEGRWKKDYKQGGIREIKVEDNGLMVYFRSKRILIDPVSGDEMMKKPEKVERAPWSPDEKEPMFTFTFAGKPAAFMSPTALKVGETTYRFDRIALDAERERLIIANSSLEKSNLKRESYGYLLTVVNLKDDSKQTKEFTIFKGVNRLEVNSAGNVIAYNDFASQFISLSDGGIDLGISQRYNPISRKGARAARRLANLLGGADEDDSESVPTHLRYDYDLKFRLERPGFDPLSVGRQNVQFIPLLGTKSEGVFKGMPFFSLVNKDTGDIEEESVMVYDNSDFTLDERRNKIYLLHGPYIRWYAFE